MAFGRKKNPVREAVVILLKLKVNDHPYKGRTKKEADEHNQIIDRYVDEVFERKDSYLEGYDELFKERKRFRERFERLETERQETIERGRELYKEMEMFLEGTNFYPMDIVFDVNKLKGIIDERDEDLHGNPIELIEKTEQLSEIIEENYNSFLSLHKEVVSVIQQKRVSEQMEHELSLALHKGSYELVRDLLKKLKNDPS
ncbi:hypothetical protein IMZ31_20515 (plasmid) [Pontibacillus sp. ALD_SL1]|uniref:hypothetical protein n=1 Tax=Pontibacillus sp. ALD_SL1 TaxID=2777185 RepID=UPI001A967BDA|nr:hypothetical protein [Pontibacillus sp. ALD_SL1]QST02934.1 hypothetical protein IMZ31_20515 [Pontibacillus sp. ALD_SL1]